MLAQWGVPVDHFDRLPYALQAEELTHFTREKPRDITLRAVQDEGQDYGAIRSVMSSITPRQYRSVPSGPRTGAASSRIHTVRPSFVMIRYSSR